ncbi:hypothetical protein JTE90_020905 [Oedothorax gibbosus]|uniref:Uncharacterized protein n=1 Tax=Oedothorax gibbosus TaxID=931172 RepID=A0AAV6VN09_9ARAC|nr:hypothetical protein JTE90_020905 [Oedothorax gibbosus]
MVTAFSYAHFVSSDWALNYHVVLERLIYWSNEMGFERSGRNSCSTFTTLPARRNSTSSLLCEASSMYPSMRQGSHSHLNKAPSEAYISQLSDIRLPPPSSSRRQGRRASVTSSQGGCSRAAHAGTYNEYAASRCHSSLNHAFSMDPDMYKRDCRSEIMGEVHQAATSNRQRVWSETGRSYDETTIRASLRNFRNPSEYLVPGSRQPSTRRRACDEQSIAEAEDLMSMSFSDSIKKDPSLSIYEQLPKKRRDSRDHRGYNHCYDNPSSLDDDFNIR